MCRSRHPHHPFVFCHLNPEHKKRHAAVGLNPGQYLGNQPHGVATTWPNKADLD